MNPTLERSQSEELYLLVEGSIPHLTKQLYQLPGLLEQEPLFLHPPYQTLLSVSPILIKATPEVQQWFIELNQYQHGYFFSSHLTLSDVAKSLRRLIMAQTPENEMVFLRFFGSNVAYILLDTQCTMLWQPMSKVWLHQSGEWQRLDTPFKVPPVVGKSPIKITDEQWQRFQHLAWQSALPKTLEAHMLEWFPEFCRPIDDLNRWVCIHMETAYVKGFETEQDLLCYFNILGYLGEEVLLENTHPNLTQLMDTPSLQTPSQRIAQAANLAEQIANKTKENRA
ncbi:DUF4123 domain-containing protein [Vibrio sp. YMD68]|uniref:DUF4123 domain-containing protein n=1 Tax=Vibrio sp. YMD68 TaxID=3042300 RepID=UPI00249C8D16|nr:DUF4123 domain-containing protein [Vibrio sp. YMD68]WGW00131.1 DUF4123 domain-containing protein [Vibrio sp. YMD68]